MKRITDKMEWLLELGGTKRDIVFLVISGVALLASMFHLLPLPFDAAWVAIILCGVPIMMEAFIGLVTEFDIKADVLVSIALLASVVIGEDFAAGEVAFIMQIGGLLEELTVAKARAGIEKLVHLTPQTARVISDAGEEIIAAELVVKDALLRVLPGETIPVDGVIVKGETSVNQAVLTGESLPVDKGVGDEVFSGTVNQFGAFEMRATRVGEDSSIQRMIRLVQSADAGKAKIVGIADRWATWIVVAALSAAALTWLVTGEIIRAVTILVVFCPCALVLATPTAIMAGIGNATRHGFLVREGDALERLAKVNRIAFDKTGTLTFGQPCVTAIKSYSEACPEKELYAYAAAAEQYSEHPLGKAIVTCYKKEEGNVLQQAEGFCLLAGQGVTATVAGKVLCIGNERLLQANEATIPEKAREDADRYIREGSTVIYVAEEKQFLGFLVLSDTMRGDSAGMIQKLQAQGVVPMLLTGDHDAAAMHIARQAGISAVHADCLPEDKLNWISTYQKRGESIAMIGDGINDAPALKMADVGIAMGGVGSDIAVDAADIALVDDEIKELPHLMALSKKMMRTIHLNLTFSLTLNFIAVALAITGILNPVVGALVHNAGSVLVILNSFFVLNYKSHLN